MTESAVRDDQTSALRQTAPSLRHATLVVAGSSSQLRRDLRPVGWVTLEEVALDAVLEDGRFVARTSARLVAERLGMDPGTTASALRDLRERGLLVLEREKGPAGRFGLSVYVLQPVGGLKIVFQDRCDPSGQEQHVHPPGAAIPGASAPCVVLSPTEPPQIGEPPVDEACTTQTSPSHSAPALQIPGQGTLDLDGGVA
jgi:hypothetical protein